MLRLWSRKWWMKSSKNMQNKNIRIVDIEEITTRSKKFCAYSERSRMDVLKKLLLWKVPELWHEKIINQLYSENYLSDERFIKLYIQSKINQNKWGKLKIKAGLINHGFSDIETEKYFTNEENQKISENLEFLISKKSDGSLNRNDTLFLEQLKKYLYNKGYEPEMILQKLKF
jgi:regulatory protein